MNISIACLNCSHQFAVPETARGQTLACPRCGGRVTVPPPVSRPARRPGVAELVDEELRAKKAAESAPPVSPGVEKTAAALGIPRRKLFAKPLIRFQLWKKDAEGVPRYRPRNFFVTHKLVCATIIFSAAYMILGSYVERPALGAILAAIGLAIAAGVTRSQAWWGSERRAAERWRFFEKWFGAILILCVIAAGTWLVGGRLQQLVEAIPIYGITKPMVLFVVVQVAGWLLFAAICIWLQHLSERQGFFKTIAWTYMACFLLLCGLIIYNSQRKGRLTVPFASSPSAIQVSNRTHNA